MAVAVELSSWRRSTYQPWCRARVHPLGLVLLLSVACKLPPRAERPRESPPSWLVSRRTTERMVTQTMRELLAALVHRVTHPRCAACRTSRDDAPIPYTVR